MTKSSCVAPAVVSYQQLLDQLGGGKSMSYKLTPGDIKKLSKSTSTDAVSFDIPNGVKVTSLDENQFYQVNVPPTVTADGTPQSSGPAERFRLHEWRHVYGRSYSVGVGDTDQQYVVASCGHRSFTYCSARNASCGISTWPTCFMRFLPSFCFSSSLRLRVMSPP